MAAAPLPTDLPDFSPGLLLTHDWTQIHTPRGLRDTTITEVDTSASSSYQTDIFQITNALQFEAFVHRLGRCDIDNRKSCPLQLVPGYDCENAGDCPEKTISAIVKMTYKETHVLSEVQGGRLLSDDVIKDLQDIEHKISGGDVPKADIIQFLKRFGSHFPIGVQKLGKCYSWIVVLDEQCNMDLLGAIAEEVFVICDRYVANIPGSHEGIWYSLNNVLNSTSWGEEKKKLLQSARLCVTHHGSYRNKMSLKEWKQNDFVKRPVKVDPLSDSIVSVWDLIEQSQMKFELRKKLSLMIYEEWKRLAKEMQHSDTTTFVMKHIDIPRVRWCNLLDELKMTDHLQTKVTLQRVRSLHIQKEGPIAKSDLPWRVLNQVMLLNSMCYVEDISKFAKETKGSKTRTRGRGNRGRSTKNANKAELIPHPMDMTLLIFLCSDFMLRQVLAKKLFMCCLAIPFIVPTPEDTVEILLWPLRSIVMEWRTKQEAQEQALVSSRLNMVVFIRVGETSLSKSKLMNTVLLDGSHDVFCHKDTACGDEQRQISNGIVEVSHFLPSASTSDHFSQPALFFNLRGDACDYRVQRSLMMELATVLVILVDLQELQTKTVQELLCETVKTIHRVVIILTDNKNHGEEDRDKLLNDFDTLLGDSQDDIEVIYTFKDGKPRNSTYVTQDVRDSISEMMVQDPRFSLEDFAARTKQCTVDESANKHCEAGKRVAAEILSGLEMIAIDKRKPQLLPQQGQSLHEVGKLLRKLHRSSGKDASDENEKTKRRLKDIKNRQLSASKGNRFMKNIISMFRGPAETKRFGMHWIQMTLDAISSSVLPELHREKNQIWKEMMKAKEEKKDCVPGLEKKIDSLQQQIDHATFGLEHIMREMAHLYDVHVAADLEQLKADDEYDLSSLPDIVAQLLLEGQPVELMDGDHDFIPLSWVKAVFHSLTRLVGEKKLFVLSVMGIQSSGKSTLLNTLFGLEFAVSAGRCTRGIYTQLLPVANGSHLPYDYILVLDSEGLRSQELGQQNYQHDNELATLVVGLSDLALFNIKGENVMEITEIIQIVVLAFLRIKQADSTHRNKCMFIHQNVSAVNVEEKLEVDRQKVQEQLNIMTQQASESQGLHQTITSFNQVINFDCEQDIFYFSDLWHGDPPMAPVNQGYSRRAAETRQHILKEVSQNCKTFLTISDFVFRIEDMWKAVLADDFVFNFRNSIAAKAYLDLEREFARLTMEMEENLLKWVNTICTVEMLECKTEPDVDAKCVELQNSLRERVSELKEEKENTLGIFFENHPASEIVMQWRSEKKSSLHMFADTVQKRMYVTLENMNIRRRVEIQHQHLPRSKEQEIMAQAIAFAKQLRGKCLDDALEKKFDEIWNPWAEKLIAASYQQTQNTKDTLDTILWEKMHDEGNQQYLKTERKGNPATVGSLARDIKYHDLNKHRISVKDVKENAVSIISGAIKTVTEEAIYLNEAVEQANAMMAAVMEKVKSISQQDIMFDLNHGRQVIDFALGKVTEYNDQKHIPFSFTQQFRALFAVRVVHYAAPHFECMSKRYEEKHGIHAKLKPLRQRVFKQFKNAVKDASIEVTVSDDFCETIKEALIDCVRQQINEQIRKNLHQELGLTKYDLITKILDDIAARRSFSDLWDYVHTPVPHAIKWVQTFGENLMFGEQAGSRYPTTVHTNVEGIIAKVKKCTRDATDSVTSMKCTRYGSWISKFYEAMKKTIALDKKQLEINNKNTDINNFHNFQQHLDESLDELEQDLKEDLCQARKKSLNLVNGGNPFQTVFDRLWGCQKFCPMCNEPCQHTDSNHTTSHSCIQHRLPGVIGMKHAVTGLLWITTCNMDVASERTFGCAACSYECRNTPHCTKKNDVFHPYRDYKTFLPRWDIAPDSSGEASKFWKWVMCTFKDQLVEKYKWTYHVTGVEIPESWKDITEQQARNSVKEFFK